METSENVSQVQKTTHEEWETVDMEQKWRLGFEAMVDDPASLDVGYAVAAQREVVLGELSPMPTATM